MKRLLVYFCHYFQGKRERLRTHVHNNGWWLSIFLCYAHTHKYAHTQVRTHTSIHYSNDWFVDGYIPNAFRQNSKMKKLLCISAHYSQGKREIVYARITVINVLGVTHTHTSMHTHTRIHYNDDRFVDGCISVKNLIQWKWKGLKKIPCVFLHGRRVEVDHMYIHSMYMLVIHPHMHPWLTCGWLHFSTEREKRL